jgi:hypothetical protein
MTYYKHYVAYKSYIIRFL